MKASWITSVLGYVIIGVTWLNQVFVEHGVPSTASEWKNFIIANVAGLIGVYAKDYNKSNAPKPEAVSKPVV